MKQMPFRLLFAMVMAGAWFTSVAQRPPRPSVAILIFEGVQIIDYTGPYETFGQAGYQVFTVGEKTEPLTTSMGMKVTPSYSLASAPPADVLVIPGGAMPHDLPADHPVVRWILEREPRVKHILTVCNGAFALGPTGLLDGRQATTTAGMISHLQSSIPKVIPVYDKRFVHDGKIISAGGLSAGIDAALYVISLLDSPARSQEVANKMEYNWDPSGKYVRTRLVDFQLSRLLDFNPPLRGKTITYEGDEQSWTAAYELMRRESLADFSGQLTELARSHGWSLVSEKNQPTTVGQEWKMKDHNGVAWSLVAEFAQLQGENQYRVTFRLRKV